MARVTPVLACLALTGAACTTVAPVPSPATFIAGTKPQQVWITRQDRTVVALGAPRIVGDTVFGFVGTTFQEIPVASISEMRAVQGAPTRTAVLALGFSAVAIAGFFVMNAQSNSSTPSSCEGSEDGPC